MERSYDNKIYLGLITFILLFLSLSSEFVFAKRISIGFSFPSYKESRWHYDLLSFQQLLPEDKYKIFVKFSSSDQEHQNAQILELIDNDIDVLIVAPNDAKEIAAMIDYAKLNNIYVISYDRLVLDCEPDVFISFDNYKVGSIMAKYSTFFVPKGKYIIINGPTTDPNAVLVQRGIKEHLNPFIESGDVVVVLEENISKWRYEEAKKLVTKALEIDKDIDVIIAPNDDTALGAFNVIKENNIDKKVIITGQDGTPNALMRIYAGEQSMTVFKDPNLLASECINLIEDKFSKKKSLYFPTTVFNGKKDVPTIFLPILFVQKKTLPFMLRLPEFKRY